MARAVLRTPNHCVRLNPRQISKVSVYNVYRLGACHWQCFDSPACQWSISVRVTSWFQCMQHVHSAVLTWQRAYCALQEAPQNEACGALVPDTWEAMSTIIYPRTLVQLQLSLYSLALQGPLFTTHGLHVPEYQFHTFIIGLCNTLKSLKHMRQDTTFTV